jgi:hypothetical protein
MATIWPSVILGGTALIISAYFAWYSKKLNDDKIMKELFTEFNQRYDVLNGRLTWVKSHITTSEDLNLEENSEYRHAIIDYFNLYAEEFYWYYHKKRIDPLVWNSWQAGMNYWYNEVPSIKALWMEEVKANGKASYYINDKVEFFKDKE